jgi:ABC-type microcin C transport system permease subunit YejB
MGIFVAQRLLSTIPVLAVVAIFVFLMLRLTPGDPAAVIAGNTATSAEIAEIRDSSAWTSRSSSNSPFGPGAASEAISAKAFSSRRRSPN